MVAQSQSITSNLGYIKHLSSNRCLDLAVHGLPREAIKASVVVSQRSADPSLHIAHVPQEVLALGRFPHILQLIRRLAQPIQAVAHLLEAVIDGLVLFVAQPLELGQLRDERFGVLGSGQADGEGGLGQLAGALLDGGGVGREGLDAEVWVGGGAA